MASIETMDELFIEELRDLYDAEKQLTKALPKMAEASSSSALRSAFEEHLTQTEGHVQRLEQIFEVLGEKASGKTCAAMKGLIKEGDEIASDTEDTAVRDAGLIAAAQKVEHYEISGYGSVRTHAKLLGHQQAVSMLEATLNEEKQADRKLNDLAENFANPEAAGTSTAKSGGKTRTAGGSSRYEV